MRHLTVGYNLVVFSPLLSLLLLFLAPPSALLEVTALIIGVQMYGMILYLVGYRKSSNPSETPRHILLSGIFLVVWGFLIAWYIIIWYNFHVEHYLPEKPLSFLDNVNYALYVLKGLLWAASGLMFIITRITQTFRAHQTFHSHYE